MLFVALSAKSPTVVFSSVVFSSVVLSSVVFSSVVLSSVVLSSAALPDAPCKTNKDPTVLHHLTKEVVADLGSVTRVERYNGQTDVLHQVMKKILFIPPRELLTLRHWRALPDGSVLTVEMPVERADVPDRTREGNMIRAEMNAAYLMQEVVRGDGKVVCRMDRVFDLDVKLGELPAFVLRRVEDFNIGQLSKFPERLLKAGSCVAAKLETPLHESPIANFPDSFAPSSEGHHHATSAGGVGVVVVVGQHKDGSAPPTAPSLLGHPPPPPPPPTPPPTPLPPPSVPPEFKMDLERKIKEWSATLATEPRESGSGWTYHSSAGEFDIFTRPIAPGRTSLVRMVGQFNVPLRNVLCALTFVGTEEPDVLLALTKDVVVELDAITRVARYNGQTDVLHQVMKKILFIPPRELLTLRHWRALPDGSVLTVEMPVERADVPDQTREGNMIRAEMNAAYLMQEVVRGDGKVVCRMDRVFDLDVKLGELPAFVLRRVEDFNIGQLSKFPERLLKAGLSAPPQFNTPLHDTPIFNALDTFAPPQVALA
jgi:hypothetical protein